MMTCIKCLNVGMVLTCVIGIGLSYYAYYVETMSEKDSNYEAMCDISEHISCTKVFLSEYGKGFGLVGKILGQDSSFNRPNGLGGIVFYTIVAALSFINSLRASQIQIAFCLLSNVMTVYLAYILFIILVDFCVVCVSTYIINCVSLYLAISKYRLLSAAPTTSSQAKKKAN